MVTVLFLFLNSSLVGNSGRLTWVRHSSCKSSAAHCYQSVRYFSCVQTMVWLPVFEICNVCTDVDARNWSGQCAIACFTFLLQDGCMWFCCCLPTDEFTSVQNGIYALGKAHCIPPRLSEVSPSIAFKTSPVFVFAHPFKDDYPSFPLSPGNQWFAALGFVPTGSGVSSFSTFKLWDISHLWWLLCQPFPPPPPLLFWVGGGPKFIQIMLLAQPAENLFEMLAAVWKLGPGTVGDCWPCLHFITFIFIQPNKHAVESLLVIKVWECLQQNLPLCQGSSTLHPLFAIHLKVFSANLHCHPVRFSTQLARLSPECFYRAVHSSVIQSGTCGTMGRTLASVCSCWIDRCQMNFARNCLAVPEICIMYLWAKGCYSTGIFFTIIGIKIVPQMCCFLSPFLCIFVVNHMWYEQVKNVSWCSKFLD